MESLVCSRSFSLGATQRSVRPQAHLSRVAPSLCALLSGLRSGSSYHRPFDHQISGRTFRWLHDGSGRGHGGGYLGPKGEGISHFHLCVSETCTAFAAILSRKNAGSLAAFLGPVIAPIASGFLGKSNLGWRSVFYAMSIFGILTYAMGLIFIPETYGPLLKRKRAAESEILAVREGAFPQKSAGQALRKSLSRPFILLFTEAIVILLAIWVSFVYGTLYLYFAAYPLVFQADRPKGYGMGAGIGDLPFLGIGAGMVVGTCIAFITDRQYIRRMDSSKEAISPEARLPPACVGAVCLPISLALFAATSDPSIHWIAPTLACIPFGIGLVLIFVSVISYLIDTYGIYCASALGANAVLRSLFAAAFPMFATKMYEALGQRWATGVLAFFALACLPLPFVFYRYGAAIRRKSRFASRADC